MVMSRSMGRRRSQKSDRNGITSISSCEPQSPGEVAVIGPVEVRAARSYETEQQQLCGNVTHRNKAGDNPALH